MKLLFTPLRLVSRYAPTSVPEGIVTWANANGLIANPTASAGSVEVKQYLIFCGRLLFASAQMQQQVPPPNPFLPLRACSDATTTCPRRAFQIALKILFMIFALEYSAKLVKQRLETCPENQDANQPCSRMSCQCGSEMQIRSSRTIWFWCK
jgi:hypothetical protein